MFRFLSTTNVWAISEYEPISAMILDELETEIGMIRIHDTLLGKTEYTVKKEVFCRTPKKGSGDF
jgi:hypothetical protein